MLALLLTFFAYSGDTWQTPPDPIAGILDAQKPPGVTVSPDQAWMLELARPSLPPMSELAESKVKLAGMGINPDRYSKSRLTTWRGVTVRPLGKGSGKPIRGLPEDLRMAYLDWSFTSQYASFSNVTPTGLELWIIDVEAAEARKLTGPVLNGTGGAPCDWLPDDQGLVCKFRVADAELPVRSAVPAGPRIEQNLGQKRPGRTWQNLLKDQHDEALFEALITSQLDEVALDGTRKALVKADRIWSMTPSPDGTYLRVTSFEPPFSRTVPATRFAKRTEIFDRSGKLVYEVAKLPLADAIPTAFGSVRQGRRSISWRADKPASLYWAEALDEGDAGKEAEQRDVLYTLDAPFDGEPKALWRSELRFSRVVWGDDQTALASEYWYDTRTWRQWRIAPDGSREPQKLFDLNYQDAYADPGDALTSPGPFGWQTLHRTSRGEILLSGRGASPEGVFPFLDRMNLESGATRRLWRAQDPYYETLSEVLDPDGKRLMTRRQSKEEPPNYGLRKGRRWKAITDFEDWAPDLAGLDKQLVTTTRKDGVELSATLYTPPGYDKDRDGPLPTIFWAYPREHKSKKTASQVTTSENTFSRPGGASVLFMLTQGYAVLSGPTMPIIGEGDVEPNDTYIEQLVSSAEAHVDHVAGLGIVDRDRIAIGGHSYGAFTTANLLAHSDLFRAGIARSGAYNRSLTPFGFQGEQRSYWEAMPVYQTMSPFMSAPKIDEPLLLLHGAEDSNSGTYPIQSDRLYNAIKGHGGTVRWVELPYEDHGYRSREGVSHALWEMVTWLDTYVKNAEPRSTTN